MNTIMFGTAPGQVTSDQNDTHSTIISTKEFPTTNNEFLATIFKGITEPLRPIVLGFAGAPKDQKAWGGEAWEIEKNNCDGEAQNWYFTLATYQPADDRYRRREKDCASVYGVMLDDLGTKALPLERLYACPPSYVIETSEGNFQAGYLFTEPVTKFDVINALNQSLVEAGMSDPGAKSPTTRYGRLPFASNCKADPAFHCRLTEWHPGRRYTVEEIIERLELAPPQAINKSLSRTAAEDGVYIPRPNENEVITALKIRGLYKQSLGSGRHDVTCPWVHEHTDQTDQGSAYFEPSDLYPIGGFKCQHGHGEKYRIKALLEFLGVTIQAAKHKPIIMISAGEIDRIVDAAERELAASGCYYQRGGQIVGIATDIETGDASIKPMSQPALLRALSGCAIWMRHDGRSAESVVIDPPARHVGVLFDSGSYFHLPALTGIARQPHLRPDGTLVRDAGFDSVTGRYGKFDPLHFDVPESPSKAQAVEALQELRELLSEFEFASQNDHAAALAGILTAAIRPCLQSAPMIHVQAPVISSGKSFLCSIFVAFAGPAAPSALAFPTNEEECQKLLLAALMTSPPAIVFDNLTTDIVPFKSLCSALTEEYLTGRILGVSKTATVGTRVLFLSSGNNVAAVRDMARRCLTISLDPKVETPATRKFIGNPLAAVRGDRERYVSLALTIIRAWIVAGKPTANISPLASYEQWTAWVRQPLIWLGMADPAACVFAQLEQDPDREVLGRLLHAWHAEFGTKPTMIRDALEKISNHGQVELREALREVAEERGEINRRRLGKWIARHKGRIVDGMRFERVSGTTSAERWSVKSVTSVTSVRSLEGVPNFV